MVAARTSSFFCWMAALWLFVSPWAYFGVSDQRSAWNAWIVGALMVVASLVRLIHPRSTYGFSVVNAVLSLWVLASPFVFGYTSQKGRLANTLTIGAATLSFSLLSLLVSKDAGEKLATPDISD